MARLNGDRILNGTALLNDREDRRVKKVRRRCFQAEAGVKTKALRLAFSLASSVNGRVVGMAGA